MYKAWLGKMVSAMLQFMNYMLKYVHVFTTIAQVQLLLHSVKALKSQNSFYWLMVYQLVTMKLAYIQAQSWDFFHWLFPKKSLILESQSQIELYGLVLFWTGRLQGQLVTKVKSKPLWSQSTSLSLDLFLFSSHCTRLH